MEIYKNSDFFGPMKSYGTIWTIYRPKKLADFGGAYDVTVRIVQKTLMNEHDYFTHALIYFYKFNF